MHLKKTTMKMYIACFLLAHAVARAAHGQCSGDACKITNPIGVTNIATLVARFIKTIVPFLGTAALIMFIVGAIHWILSSGSPEKVKKGQDAMVWAVLGAAVAIGGYLALKFIFQVLTGNLKFT